MSKELNKNMTFEEIKETVNEEFDRFWDMQNYLNENGKNTMYTFQTLRWCCTFSQSKNELKEQILDEIEKGRTTGEKEIRNLNHFIKNILQED